MLWRDLLYQLDRDAKTLGQARERLIKNPPRLRSYSIAQAHPTVTKKMSSFCQQAGAKIDPSEIVMALGVQDARTVVNLLDRPPTQETANTIDQILVHGQNRNFGQIPELQELRNCVAFAMDPKSGCPVQTERYQRAQSRPTKKVNLDALGDTDHAPAKHKKIPVDFGRHVFTAAIQASWRHTVKLCILRSGRSKSAQEQKRMVDKQKIDLQLAALQNSGVGPDEIEELGRLVTLKGPTPLELMRDIVRTLKEAREYIAQLQQDESAGVSKGLAKYARSALQAVADVVSDRGEIPNPKTQADLAKKAAKQAKAAERERLRDEKETAKQAKAAERERLRDEKEADAEAAKQAKAEDRERARAKKEADAGAAKQAKDEERERARAEKDADKNAKAEKRKVAGKAKAEERERLRAEKEAAKLTPTAEVSTMRRSKSHSCARPMPENAHSFDGTGN